MVKLQNCEPLEIWIVTKTVDISALQFPVFLTEMWSWCILCITFELETSLFCRWLYALFDRSICSYLVCPCIAVIQDLSWFLLLFCLHYCFVFRPISSSSAFKTTVYRQRGEFGRACFSIDASHFNFDCSFTFQIVFFRCRAVCLHLSPHTFLSTSSWQICIFFDPFLLFSFQL